MLLNLGKYAKVEQQDIFALTTLEIILASFVVKNIVFQRYIFAMEICDSFSLFEKSRALKLALF